MQVKHEAPVTVTLDLAREPASVIAAPPDSPGQGVPIAVAWADGQARIELPAAGECVLWIDPVIDVTRAPEPLTLTVTDGAGEYRVELQTAIADNGEIVAFGQIDPREPGLYTFSATGEGTEILVQDRWDMTLSARRVRGVRAPWREAAEIFVRYAPGTTPRVQASLQESHRGRLVSLLRNGGFEEGSPDYPPRSWTISHPRQMGFTWPYWSQEDAVEGRSCLKFVRPEIRMTLISQPMRLRTGGTYVLRFQARGNATEAKVTVTGQRGSGGEIVVEASEDWREYRAEVPMEPGYTTVRVYFWGGGEPDQVLWVDDMEFGYVPE